MSFFYLSSFISLIPIIILLIATVFAFRTQKNWATVTLLTGVTLYVGFIIFSYYQTSRILSSSMANDTTDFDQFIIILEIATYSTPFIILIGIAGYMHTSKSIHEQTIALQQENQALQQQLNQTNR